MRSLLPLLLAPFLASSAASGEDPNQAEASLLSSYEAAWSAHDAGKVADYFTDDAVYEDVTLGEVHRGKSAIKVFAEGTFAILPEYKIKPQSIVVGTGSAAVEWVMSGTYPETGKSFSVRGVSVMQFENGKIRRNSDYWNMAEFQRQIGVPGSGGA